MKKNKFVTQNELSKIIGTIEKNVKKIIENPPKTNQKPAKEERKK